MVRNSTKKHDSKMPTSKQPKAKSKAKRGRGRPPKKGSKAHMKLTQSKKLKKLNAELEKEASISLLSVGSKKKVKKLKNNINFI